MVGVPGKYQGCNTCRLRRVKCDNERPVCRKCINTGRECGGYERETVFIVGTIEDGGRCSSHPPRVIKNSNKPKAAAAASKSEDGSRAQLVADQPLQPAWADSVSLSYRGFSRQVQMAALHTSLQALKTKEEDEGGERFAFLSLPAYEPANVGPSFADDQFDVKAQCLVHLDKNVAGANICIFLYEHNNSVHSSNLSPWKNAVLGLGPEAFRSFPSHHFFARVYRHNAVFAAMLNRKPTFLAAPEWVTTPWELHGKCDFDRLYDHMVLLPSIFSRADGIFAHDATLARRLMAQDLLVNCLHVEQQLHEWFAAVSNYVNTIRGGRLYWPESATGRADALMPFSDAFAFPDGATAVMLVHYWAALVLLAPCVERLHAAVTERPMDAWGPHATHPNLPPRLAAVDPLRYGAKETRELAANVCRGLGSALTAAQPDLLAGPLHVVADFYRRINAAAPGDGQLELMWCDAFGARLQARGQEMAAVVARLRWQHLATF